MSWDTVKLSDFLRVRDDRFKPNDAAIEGLKRVDKIDFSGQIYLSNSPSKTDMILIKRGDLLISGINVYKGAVAVYEGAEDITATIHYSSYEYNKKKIDVEFLKLFLKSPEFLDAIREQVPGGIKTEIKPKHLLPLEVVIPDLKGQREVIENFSKVETTQNILTAELTRQLDFVKQLRQSFLREAMQGKLVPQDPNDKPASELLQKIKDEKEKLIKEKKLKKDKPLSELKPEEIPFEIPENWVWRRLGEICDLKRGKSKHRPRNDKRLFENGIYPFIQTGDVSKAKYNKDLITTVNGYYNDFGLKQSEIQTKGTLCITIAANIAECGFLYFDACVPDSIVCLFADDKITEKYVYYYLKIAKEELERFAPATAQKNINLGILNELSIPLPPLPEQHLIVAKLEQLMRFCDDLEQSIRQSKEQTNMLLQAALREALKGKEKIALVEGKGNVP